VNDNRAVEESTPLKSNWVIECPSMVFVILKKKEKEPYTFVKGVTNFYHGLQSQCLVWETFKKQKRPVQ
jgi:hypothetical protein